MRGISDAHHFRKLVAGTCMVLSPVLVLAAGIIQPEPSMTEGTQLAIVRDNLDAWYVSQLLSLVAIVLALPAVLGLMHMLREREAAWGHVGGGLALLGLMAYVGVATTGLVQWQMAHAGNTGAMTDLLQRMHQAEGFFLPFAIGAVAFGVGMICLAVGLYRARAVHSWMSIALALAAACIAGAGFTASSAVFIVGAAFLAASLCSIGLMVLGESDADWERTPEYTGFRPMTGMR